jgi:mannosyl-oligosaccharide alpha-1,2-mannosidase
MALAINKVCRTDTGFGAISSITATDGGQKLDKQRSFVFAEMLTYMWLTEVEVSAHGLNIGIHADFCRIRMLAGMCTCLRNERVFNIEAHPFSVAGISV